jgi:hypothetical protein
MTPIKAVLFDWGETLVRIRSMITALSGGRA